MKTISKEAKKDAEEYARARMFYGEGAGTRRKLINTEVDYKSARIPGYYDLFMEALGKQDMAEHANKARQERRRKDVSKKVDRNVRGLATGNRQSLTTGVMVVVTVGYFAYRAHEAGFDKELIAYAKPKYYRAKGWVQRKKNELFG